MTPLESWQRERFHDPRVIDKIVTVFGPIQVATASTSSGGFVAWGKVGEIVSDGVLTEPGEPVWFKHGKTRKECAEYVLREILTATKQ